MGKCISRTFRSAATPVGRFSTCRRLWVNNSTSSTSREKEVQWAAEAVSFASFGRKQFGRLYIIWSIIVSFFYCACRPNVFRRKDVHIVTQSLLSKYSFFKSHLRFHFKNTFNWTLLWDEGWVNPPIKRTKESTLEIVRDCINSNQSIARVLESTDLGRVPSQEHWLKYNKNRCFCHNCCCLLKG